MLVTAIVGAAAAPAPAQRQRPHPAPQSLGCSEPGPPIPPAYCAPLQVGVFSATLPPEALEITRKFMNKVRGRWLVWACLSFNFLVQFKRERCGAAGLAGLLLLCTKPHVV